MKIQSHWKGHQARKAYNERKHFLNEQQPAAVRIQVRNFMTFSFDRSYTILGVDVEILLNHKFFYVFLLSDDGSGMS